MNLAFVNAAHQLGGAETVARDLVDGCGREGHATRLHVAQGKTYPQGTGIVPMYPRVLSRLHHSRLHAQVERVAPRNAWTDRAFRTLADGWADVVHLHAYHGDYARLETLAYVARRKPFVWTLHGHWGITGGCDHPLSCRRFEEACGECPRLGVWPLGLVDDTAAQFRIKLEILGSLPLHVVAPSALMARRIAASPIARHWQIHHISNGVSTAAFNAARKGDPSLKRALTLDPSRTTVLVVNRNFRDREKGFPIVREALAGIRTGGGAPQIILTGEHSDWAASQLPSDLPVRSLGFIESRRTMAELFEVAEIALFASMAENFPCVVLEAMASACCVVSTPTSGVVEQVDDGRTGLLAAAITGDALAQALRVAIDDGGLRSRLGTAAREYVKTAWSMETFIARHLALYESIVAARRPS